MNEKNHEFVDMGENSLEKSNNRIEKSFGDLIGKKFEKGDIIPLSYESSDGKKIEFQFNTNTNNVLINDRDFSVKPLEGINISNIEFTDKKIIIYGKIGIVDGKLEATYEETIKGFDEIYLYATTNNK